MTFIINNKSVQVPQTKYTIKYQQKTWTMRPIIIIIIVVVVCIYYYYYYLIYHIILSRLKRERERSQTGLNEAFGPIGQIPTTLTLFAYCNPKTPASMCRLPLTRFNFKWRRAKQGQLCEDREEIKDGGGSRMDCSNKTTRFWGQNWDPAHLVQHPL